METKVSELISAQVLGSWKFIRDTTYTVQDVGTTGIFLYQVSDGVFAGVVPASNYSVTASSESECLNECRAECDRYFEKYQPPDDIPF